MKTNPDKAPGTGKKERKKGRVVVLFSGSGNTLQAIIDQQNKHHYDVVAALTNRPDAYGIIRAKSANIPVAALNHNDFTQREDFDRALIDNIDEHRPDLVVLAGYMRILSHSFVDHYQGRLINIHPSLLPKHKGLNTYQAALAAGDQQHGTSVHFVANELDSGAIIARAALTIHPHDTAETLENRVKVMEQKMYPMTIDWITSGRLTRQSNSITLDGHLLKGTGYFFTEDEL